MNISSGIWNTARRLSDKVTLTLNERARGGCYLDLSGAQVWPGPAHDWRVSVVCGWRAPEASLQGQMCPSMGGLGETCMGTFQNQIAFSTLNEGDRLGSKYPATCVPKW